MSWGAKPYYSGWVSRNAAEKQVQDHGAPLKRDYERWSWMGRL
jgi:hypothetical protein